MSISIIIPPNDGISIDTIISEPSHVDVSTGISINMVVTVVIKRGCSYQLLNSRPKGATIAPYDNDYQKQTDDQLVLRTKQY